MWWAKAHPSLESEQQVIWPVILWGRLQYLWHHHIVDSAQYCGNSLVGQPKPTVSPGPGFNINMSSYQYRKTHCGGKTVIRLSYLHNGISYTGKMASSYWISPSVSTMELPQSYEKLLTLYIFHTITAQFCSYEVKAYHALNSLWSTDSTYVWGNYWYVSMGMYK